jgi:hypothetical protein
MTVHTLGRPKVWSCCPSTRKKRDADKKKANFKTSGNNRVTAVNRNGQIAYLTAEFLGVKVAVLAATGSDYSAISRSAVKDARKRGFPLKVEEYMDHPLIGSLVLDEMGFMASQHLNSVRDKFHLHDFRHIGEEISDMGKQTLSSLSKASSLATFQVY